jgi:hypothetical protein
MSLKSLHPEERREAWIRRQAEWWAQRRLDKSSEDVWDIRTWVLSADCVCCLFETFGCREPLQLFPKPITEEMLAAES